MMRRQTSRVGLHLFRRTTIRRQLGGNPQFASTQHQPQFPFSGRCATVTKGNKPTKRRLVSAWNFVESSSLVAGRWPLFLSTSHQPLLASHLLRPHRQLDFPAPRLHALKRLRQVFQSNVFRDKIARRNIPAPDRLQRLPNEPRRVMKWRNNLYFRVVNRRRLDLNVSSSRQPAEKIHHPAAPHHRQSLFPCSRVSSRFHHRIRPAALIGYST